MSSELVWLLVRKHNSFQKKGLNGIQLSAEPGNLYNLHSYKHSGLANKRTLDIAAGEGSSVVITTSRPKNANKPVHSKSTYTTKKNIRRAAKSVGKEAKKIRPDLKAAALARISAINKAQRAQQAAAAKSS